MKNFIQPFIVLLIAVLSNYDSFSQKVTFEQRELLINFDSTSEYIDNYFIKPQNIRARVSRYNKVVRYLAGTQSLNLSHNYIPMKEFKALYNTANSVAEDIFPKDVKYITGVAVHYALIDRRLKLFFQLWYLDNGKIESSKGQDSIKGEVRLIEGYYHYDKNDSVFRRINNPRDVITAKNEFMSKITIRGHTVETESALFSFQELFYLYHLNYKDSIDPTFKYNRNIASFEGIVFANNRLKLTSMFNCGECTISEKHKIADPPRPNDAANLAHLCPPSCGGGQISYPAKK